MMRTGSNGKDPNWKVLGIAGVVIAGIVGMIVAPAEAYAFIAGGVVLAVMAIDEI